MQFVAMVLKQREREANPYIPPPRPQARNGRAQSIYNYVQVEPSTGEDVATYKSVTQASIEAIGKNGADVHGSAVARACKVPLGQKSSGGYFWRRVLKKV